VRAHAHRSGSATLVALVALCLASGSCSDAFDPTSPELPAGTPLPRPYDDTPATSADGTVETRRADALGLGGASLNGRVNPKGRPTTHWFEYGPTTAYGQRTPEQSLGPKLAAHYREAWDGGVAGWAGGLTALDLAHVPGGGVDGSGVRFSEPSATDQNHVDGIGAVHLVQYAWIGTYTPGTRSSAYWGGGDADLRDARVSVSFRGNEWVGRGSELSFWMQTDLDLAKQNDDNVAQRANWALTGQPLTEALASGTWQRVEYQLRNETGEWSYAGNRVNVGRDTYVYQPLDRTLAHANNDIFHMLTSVSPVDLPRGTIDIDEFEITYRNRSVLLPSNGARVVSSPPGGDDVGRLTDGWRNGANRTWRSARDPVSPIEIVFELARPVTIDAVQIHQNPEWPSRSVDVLVSADGTSFTPLSLDAALPEQPPPDGPNFAFFLDSPYRRELAAIEGMPNPWPVVAATRVKVRINGGYRPEYWGLGEIELFGSGASFETDDAGYTVNADVVGLVPGSTVHYRLVTMHDGVRTDGGDKVYVVPDAARPLLYTRGATRIGGGTAKVESRISPMGVGTQAWFQYGPDTSYGLATSPIYCGLQAGPRTFAATLQNLTPQTTYHYRVVARNAAGLSAGEDLSFVAR